MAESPGLTVRVLHVIPSVAAVHGGPSVGVQAMARAQARIGLEVDVATTDDDGHGRQRLPLGIPVVADGVTYRYFARQTHTYRASLPLARWLRGHVRSYDVVHVHSLFSFAPVAAASAASRAGVPYVVLPVGVLNPWGVTQRRPRLKLASIAVVERRILAHAAAIHWTSPLEKHNAGELASLAPGTVIPNPVELPDHASGPWGSGGPSTSHEETDVVLFLARIDAVKGIDLLLEAFSHIHGTHPKARLVIAGSGSTTLLGELQTQAERLGVAGRVDWLGHVAGPDKDALFRKAAVFVLPSRSENFGIAAAEAMAVGTPAVVTTGVGIHDDVADAGSGLVVPPEPEAIGQAIAHFLDHPEARRAAGERAIELVATRYAPLAVARQLAALYQDITSRRAPEPRYAGL